jgi:hypothetical protein
LAKYAHLTRAPITEALIDIRIKLEDLTVDKLDEIYKSISSQYPGSARAQAISTDSN